MQPKKRERDRGRTIVDKMSKIKRSSNITSGRGAITASAFYIASSIK